MEDSFPSYNVSDSLPPPQAGAMPPFIAERASSRSSLCPPTQAAWRGVALDVSSFPCAGAHTYGTRRRLQATTPICSVSCNSRACQLGASRVTALPFVSVSNGASFPSYSSPFPFQCRLHAPHGILRPLQCCWCPLDRAGSDDGIQMWGGTKAAAPEGQKQEL